MVNPDRYFLPPTELPSTPRRQRRLAGIRRERLPSGCTLFRLPAADSHDSGVYAAAALTREADAHNGAVSDDRGPDRERWPRVTAL
jgi:hypothetical protein